MANKLQNRTEVADFQTLLASGDTPEAKALAEALKTQKNGPGNWGPKTRAAFARACNDLHIDPEAIDFDKPDEALKRLRETLIQQKEAKELLQRRENIGVSNDHVADKPFSLYDYSSDIGKDGYRPETVKIEPATVPAKGTGDMTLDKLLAPKKLTDIKVAEFPQAVVDAAANKNVDLSTIPEFKYADIDGDKKISANDIGHLVATARGQRQVDTYEKAFEAFTKNPNGPAPKMKLLDEPNISAADLPYLRDPKTAEKAREFRKDINQQVFPNQSAKGTDDDIKSTLDTYIDARAANKGLQPEEMRKKIDLDHDGKISSTELTSDLNTIQYVDNQSSRLKKAIKGVQSEYDITRTDGKFSTPQKPGEIPQLNEPIAPAQPKEPVLNQGKPKADDFRPRTKEEALTLYVSSCAQIEGVSEEKIRQRLDPNGNGVSPAELVAEFNRAPKVQHTPDGTSYFLARPDLYMSMGGAMGELSKHYHINSASGTWKVGDAPQVPANTPIENKKTNGASDPSALFNNYQFQSQANSLVAGNGCFGPTQNPTEQMRTAQTVSTQPSMATGLVKDGCFGPTQNPAVRNTQQREFDQTVQNVKQVVIGTSHMGNDHIPDGHTVRAAANFIKGLGIGGGRH